METEREREEAVHSVYQNSPYLDDEECIVSGYPSLVAFVITRTQQLNVILLDYYRNTHNFFSALSLA